MKILLKCVAIFLFIGLLTPNLPVSAAMFKDVTSFSKEIDFLTSKGIINGYSDKTFRPNLPIQRVHAVQMIIREMGVPLGDSPNPNFLDVKTGDPGYHEIAKAVELGIISGKSKDKFDPKGSLTRAEMAKILVNTYELGGIYPPGFTDVSTRYWAYPFISSLAANNITVGYGDGSFKPTLTIDRAHFAAFMARIIEPSFQPKNSQMADSYLEAILDVQPVDYDSHPTEPIIYLLDGNTNEVVSFNYDTYEIKSVPLDYPAERLTFANNKLYVTLLKGTHSAYWFDENQQGAFGVVDASTMTLENIIHIDLDPYDIEADDQGIVYVTSGSGQHSRIESYDGKTGKRLSSQRIYYQSLIDMHPSQNKIYAITTTVTPRNITAYPITEGILGTEQRSPYHGTYPLNKDITVSPDGKYLFNSTGHIFRSSAAASSDMHYFAKLDRPYQSIAFDLEYGELYLSDNKKYVQAYDYFTMEPIGQLTTYGNIQKMYYDEQNHVLVLFSTVQLGNSTVPFTGIEKIYFDIEENEERQ